MDSEDSEDIPECRREGLFRGKPFISQSNPLLIPEASIQLSRGIGLNVASTSQHYQSMRLNIGLVQPVNSELPRPVDLDHLLSTRSLVSQTSLKNSLMISRGILSVDGVINTMPVPDGSGLLRFPTPNLQLLVFDPGVGYQFDLATGLHYEANSGLFFNSKKKIFMRWEPSEQTYLRVENAVVAPPIRDVLLSKVVSGVVKSSPLKKCPVENSPTTVHQPQLSNSNKSGKFMKTLVKVANFEHCPTTVHQLQLSDSNKDGNIMKPMAEVANVAPRLSFKVASNKPLFDSINHLKKLSNKTIKTVKAQTKDLETKRHSKWEEALHNVILEDMSRESMIERKELKELEQKVDEFEDKKVSSVPCCSSMRHENPREKTKQRKKKLKISQSSGSVNFELRRISSSVHKRKENHKQRKSSERTSASSKREPAVRIQHWSPPRRSGGRYRHRQCERGENRNSWRDDGRSGNSGTERIIRVRNGPRIKTNEIINDSSKIESVNEEQTVNLNVMETDSIRKLSEIIERLSVQEQEASCSWQELIYSRIKGRFSEKAKDMLSNISSYTERLPELSKSSSLVEGDHVDVDKLYDEMSESIDNLLCNNGDENELENCIEASSESTPTKSKLEEFINSASEFINGGIRCINDLNLDEVLNLETTANQAIPVEELEELSDQEDVYSETPLFHPLELFLRKGKPSKHVMFMSRAYKVSDFNVDSYFADIKSFVDELKSSDAFPPGHFESVDFLNTPSAPFPFALLNFSSLRAAKSWFNSWHSKLVRGFVRYSIYFADKPWVCKKCMSSNFHLRSLCFLCVSLKGENVSPVRFIPEPSSAVAVGMLPFHITEMQMLNDFAKDDTAFERLGLIKDPSTMRSSGVFVIKMPAEFFKTYSWIKSHYRHVSCVELNTSVVGRLVPAINWLLPLLPPPTGLPSGEHVPSKKIAVNDRMNVSNVEMTQDPVTL